LTPVFFVTIELWLEKRRNVGTEQRPVSAAEEEPGRA
jgi:hypothetical protein